MGRDAAPWEAGGGSGIVVQRRSIDGALGKDLRERPDRWMEMAGQIEDSFNARYWYKEGPYLYDVLNDEHGDDSSLAQPSLSDLLAISCVATGPVEAGSGRGCRKAPDSGRVAKSAPGHRDYKSMYFGDLRARDAAYHQGTVWAWLIGHFVNAWLKAGLDISDARRMLSGYRSHLNENGMGTIDEISDAEPPYTPRGCIAQAWSVAEVLRALSGPRKGGAEFSPHGMESSSVQRL